MDEKKEQPETDVLFLQLVASFQSAAMIQLGKLANPATGKVERNLDQARHSIDLLTMLKEKTRGNLSDSERQLLDKFTFELQMNYLDETRREEATKKEEGEVDGRGVGEEEAAPAAEEVDEKVEGTETQAAGPGPAAEADPGGETVAGGGGSSPASGGGPRTSGRSSGARKKRPSKKSAPKKGAGRKGGGSGSGKKPRSSA
jgi:hypothetical protein